MKTIEQLGVSPAPWTVAVEDRRDYRLFSVEADNGAGITDFDCCPEQFDHHEGFANASLIAAAPDLYEALRLWVEELCEDCQSEIGKTCDGKCEAVRKAKAALEKAGGKACSRKPKSK